MKIPLKETLIGKPLRSEEEETEQLTSPSAIPAVGLDALASAAYGPEAALTILLVLGNAGSSYIVGISALIIALLIVVSLSYRQTIAAYPQGGGSYTVAKENLGAFPGLLAGTALCIDYVLNVAVAISAGVGALVSAFPFLLPYTLELCLLMLAFLTLINLRGVRSAGLLLLLPTYLFIASLGATAVLGIFKIVAHAPVAPVVPPPRVPAVLQTASLWLLVRAFASGCTALTGVEAVSNAVPIFRSPSADRARKTLTIIMAILAALLAGVATLVRGYGISATPPGEAGYQSVLSQIVAAVAGRGPFYYVCITSILAVLLLSANTSFTDFPRVCRLLALDRFLPAEFTHRGRRLVYSFGIAVLTGLSATLLISFGGVTDRLIPLFAVGAFAAFTLSQLGMVFHWRHAEAEHARRSMILNAVGACATGVTLVVIAVAKFMEGAWLIALAVPLLLFAFLRIQRYNERIEYEIKDADQPLDAGEIPTPIVVLPVKRLNRVTRKALRVALSISNDVHAVEVIAEEVTAEDLTKVWPSLVEEPVRRAGREVPTLVVINSKYRRFYRPLLHYVKKLSLENPQRPIAVIIPELVEKRWYTFLFRHRATILKELLLLRGGPQIMVIDAPWYVGKNHKFEG